MKGDFRFYSNAVEVHGFRCHRFETLSSTQDLLRDWVHHGALASGTVIIAEGQTQGRGRQGHSWLSLPGQGLWMSIYLRSCIPIESGFVWNMGLAVSVCEALDEVATWADWQIKWPNDLVTAQGRKVGGLLVENQIRGSLIVESLVGIGINVNQGAVESGLPFATSLMGECKVDQIKGPNKNDNLTEKLLHAVLARLESMLNRSGKASDQPSGQVSDQPSGRISDPLQGDWNMSRILAQAEGRLYGLGQRLPFECDGRTEFWIPTGLDEGGGLRVRSSPDGSVQTLNHPHYRLRPTLNL